MDQPAPKSEALTERWKKPESRVINILELYPNHQ